MFGPSPAGAAVVLTQTVKIGGPTAEFAEGAAATFTIHNRRSVVTFVPPTCRFLFPSVAVPRYTKTCEAQDTCASSLRAQCARESCSLTTRVTAPDSQETSLMGVFG